MELNGEQLFKIRKVFRLSCEEMGALMNVSGRFVSYVERGQRDLPTTRTAMLTRELDLTPEKVTRLLDIYAETELAA